MTIERKPTAFGDLRGWIDALRKAGELREIGRASCRERVYSGV